MPVEPTKKRAFAYVDGQNLFYAAREAFGFEYPNYDIRKLAQTVCEGRGWELSQAHFYTGIPDRIDNAFLNHFWNAKFAMMGRQGIRLFSRPLRYRNKTIILPDGKKHTFLVGQEKGVDVRIALDIVRAAHRQEYDVVLIFSQDQDLSEVAEEVRIIAKEQGRWIKVACAFPVSPTSRDRRGIDKTDWIRIDRQTYEACLDTRDYRPLKEQ